MQGQSPQQKKFRLGQLLRKLIQINEMYQRVEQARAHQEYREELEGKNTREALTVLSKVHFPPLNVTSRFAIGTVLCPFQSFVDWIQQCLATKTLYCRLSPSARAKMAYSS